VTYIIVMMYVTRVPDVVACEDIDDFFIISCFIDHFLFVHTVSLSLIIIKNLLDGLKI